MTHEYFKELVQPSLRFTPEQVNEFLDGLFTNAKLKNWFDLWRIGQQKQVFTLIDEDNKIFLEKRDSENFTPKGADQPITRNNFNSKKAEYLFRLERDNSKKIKRN